MFKKIQKTLEKITTKQKDKDYIEYQEIKKKWGEKIKKTIQKNVEIIDFTEGTVTLKAKNTAWKNDLIFIQEKIKKKFQTKTTQ